MDAFLVPQPTKSDADADSDATEPTGSDVEHDAERDEEGDATDSGEHGAATEYARGHLPGMTPEPPTKNNEKAPRS